MTNIKQIYFLGIGGIGMSNLARYFMMHGKKVAGYDKTQTELTIALESEGAVIHYQDDIHLIPDAFKDKDTTWVVYTPAIPKNSLELHYFIENDFHLQKRAQVLGSITQNTKALCCAGTHGKTTTSSMLAHIFHLSQLGCNAFLGGILKNYNSNLLLDENSEFTVIEADEYDRSFHWLHPYMALVTSATPDHLDIYNTALEYRKSFVDFIALIREGGSLVIHDSIDLPIEKFNTIKQYKYSLDKGDFHAENVKIDNGEIIFDFVTPTHTIAKVELGVPIKINIENAVGAMAIAYLNGIDDNTLKLAMKSFMGAKRRFDFHIKNDNFVYIDDYAHHPEEVEASIKSIKELYKGRKITGIFQPHLYSRTRDFADEFAKSLSLLDELILLDIYPAREEPIEGVDSEMLLKKVNTQKILCTKENLLQYLDNNKENIEVLVTLGAGDIDRFVQPITQLFIDKV